MDVFDKAGKTAGLEIWRIENFEAVPYAKNDYGKFYTGDSYIVLFTKKVNNAFSWNIHFWLGEQTTQDESGTAAILSVQLDDKLGGGPVQYREVQEHETQAFLSYFKSGVRYMPGGVQTGFRHVDRDKYENKLYHIKGSKNVRVKQVELSIKSMNKGDGFVLDCGKDVYAYIGIKAKRSERIKAIQVATQVRDQDHAGKATLHIIDEYCASDEVDTFFKALGGGSPDSVPEGSDDDEEFEKRQERETLLSRISDASGKLKIDAINKKPLVQSMLDTDDCFILETSSTLYVWVGKRCTANEKKEAMNRAQQFLKEKNYPKWTQIQRIVENAEPASFRQHFQSWKSVELKPHHAPVNTKPKYEVKNAGEAPEFMPDDGTGSVEVYRIENMEPVAVPKEMHGMFFGGDSYLVKYTYPSGYILYIWQGNESSTDEKASAAIHAVKMDNDLFGKAIQIRVTQGSEPKHFLHVFKGKLIIFLGGKASGFKNINDNDSYVRGKTMMFRVRGTTQYNTRGVQELPVAKYLASDDVFIVQTKENREAVWIWMGKECDKVERNLAEGFAKILFPNTKSSVIEEGSEPTEFWDSIEGKQPYNLNKDNKDLNDAKTILYHAVITKKDNFKLEEIHDFDQRDLVEDDVMLVDTGSTLFVWIGKGADETERKSCSVVAEKHLKLVKRTNTVVVIIKQGEEPESFKSLFSNWSDEAQKEQQTYEKMKSKNNFALLRAKFS